MAAAQGLPATGTRISHSGFLGTVRYTGPVEGTTGDWLGIEWDDPQRGKHDGVKDGKRYFDCLVPNSGSFIRPSASITYGRSFLNALVSKYIEDLHGSSAVEKVVLGSSGGAIEVEAVGLDKIRRKLSRLERLREISLDGEAVAMADASGSISTTCPGIRGLDLSKNLLPSWDVVSVITTELRHLQRLALNQNRLQSPTDTNIAAQAFLGITELQLNATLTTWPQMQQIISYMPVLRLVEMGYNRLQQLQLSSGDSGHRALSNSTIDEINLDGNELRHWRIVARALRPYTALRRLILPSNLIATIEPPADSTDLDLPLVSVQHLSLSFNILRAWRDVDNLPLWCPALESLTLSGNPLVEDDIFDENSRQFTIAKVPTLIVLDGVTVSAKERTDSELFYLSYVARHGPADEDARCREHPQWRALCAKHGRPDISPPTTQAKQDTLSNRLIEVRLYRCSAAPPSATDVSCAFSAPPTTIRVLPTMPTRTFRVKALKSLRAPRAQHASLRAWLHMPDGTLVELDQDDGHDLDWWGVENSSEFLVYANNNT